MRGLLQRTLLILFGLFLGIGLLVVLELVGMGVLHLTDPYLAHLLYDRRHPWLNDQPGWRVTQTMHPLWGWGNPSVRIDRSADLNVVVLGGSTVWGGLTPDRPSVPHRLQIRLNDRFDRTVNVINAGQAGWTSVNEMAFLTQRILPLRTPDAVVVMDGANDVALALQAGLLTGETGPRQPAARSPAKPSPFHPQLRRYRRQFEALQEDPMFVLNHFLHVLGLSRYFQADRYFFGVMLGTWFEAESLHPLKDQDTRRFWRTVHLSEKHRKLVRRRVRHHPSIRAFLDRPDLPKWKRTAFETFIASLPEKKWSRLMDRFRDKSSRQRQKMAAGFAPKPIPAMMDRGMITCREDPLRVDRYLDNVRTMVAAAKAHDVPILYALQPSIVFKRHLTEKERKRAWWKELHHLLSHSNFDFPVGTCWSDVTRRFYEEARAGFDRFASLESSTVRMVDLSELFTDIHDRRFVDFVHYSGPADAAIAEQLAGKLASMDLKGRRPVPRKTVQNAR